MNDDLGECHKCEECNKVFRTNARLKEHVITHTGDKPFKRNHCDKQYNLKPNLRKHKELHKNLEIFLLFEGFLIKIADDVAY